MKTSLCWLLCVSLVFLSACKRKRGAAPAAPETSGAPAVEQPAAAPPISPAATAPATANAVARPTAEVFDDRFSILTRALLTFKRDKQRGPRNWEELITTGYLKQMPTPPPGKRYIFTPTSLDVHMVNQ